MKKLTVAAGILSIAFFFSCKKELKENSTTGETTGATNFERAAGFASDSAEHVPNQLLIRFRKGTTPTGRNDVLVRISGKVQEHVLSTVSQRFGDNEGFYVVNTPMNALEALSKLKGGQNIENVELNYIYTHYEISADTYYTNGSLWGMYSDDDAVGPSGTFNKYGSQAEKAWAARSIGDGAVYIGVIDEGVMDKHTDLSGNVDPSKGWDFHNNDASTYDGTSDDHGTHVAGTIGAKGAETKTTGVVGVNWKVTMIPAKFLGPRGGSTANAIKAIQHITKLKVEQGINVIATNNSWGGSGYSKELELAIEEANKAGILFVCAAGNDGKNIDQSGSHTFPACYYNSNIIVVAALTSGGAKASYSNYGQVGLNDALGTDPNHSFVDIAAPGSGIYSTVPGKNNSSSYASYNGTSMATPHVAGAVALYAAAKGLANIDSIQAQNIKATVFDSARPTKSFYPTSAPRLSITGGRLDVYSALMGANNSGLPAD